MNADTINAERAPLTPRQARLQLNKMEAWFRKNAERYTPEERVTLRALFEEAYAPEHTTVLAEALRGWGKVPFPQERPKAGAR